MAITKIRKLIRQDLDNGFLDLLNARYYLGTLSFGTLQTLFLKIDKNPNHLIYVATQNNEIIGCATLLIIENFFSKSHNVGKILDVLIAQENKDKEIIEKSLIKKLTSIAKKRNCKKILLRGCADESCFMRISRINI